MLHSYITSHSSSTLKTISDFSLLYTPLFTCQIPTDNEDITKARLFSTTPPPIFFCDEKNSINCTSYAIDRTICATKWSHQFNIFPIFHIIQPYFPKIYECSWNNKKKCWTWLKLEGFFLFNYFLYDLVERTFDNFFPSK